MDQEITVSDRCGQVEQIAGTPFGEQYADQNGQIVDAEAMVIDLLANLRHFCDSRSLSYVELDSAAHAHYLSEKAQERTRA